MSITISLYHRAVSLPSPLYLRPMQCAKRSRSARRNGQVGVKGVVEHAAEVGFRLYQDMISSSQCRGSDLGAEDIVVVRSRLDITV